MNKLGFAIKLASAGASTAIECNKGQWSSKVVDIREYLKLFNGLQGTGSIVTFISFDEGGCFLTQLRPISGKGGDFLSGWIYIPNTIEATGDEIMNAYNYVRGILSQSNINESKEQIDDFFSKEYPSKEYVVPYLPSKGDKFGVRFLGLYTMKEILDNNRYQSYYSDCKAVFLMEKNGEVSITKEAAQNMFLDYTKKEIVKSAVLIPPTSNSLQLLGKGTKIFTANGGEFKEPMFVSVGTNQEIILKREGFENLRYNIQIQKDIVNLDGALPRDEWKKKISLSMFKVSNNKNEPIEKGLNIAVNVQDITFKEVLIPENECRDVIVKVSATDFETSESRENLLKGEIQITLRRKDKTFQSNIELANGKVAEITLKSKNLDSSHNSPLKGYNFDKDSRSENCLRMSTGFIWKQRLYGFLAALVVGLSFVVYQASDSWLDTHHFKVGLPPWEKDMAVGTTTQTGTYGTGEVENSVDTLSLENAIKYLDKNPVWDKNEMEKYPDLQGLFDVMNNFELRAIIDEWSGKLSGSENMLKIKEAAKKNSDNGWDPKQKEHNPSYNQESDTLINVSKYIKWLDKDQSKAEIFNPKIEKERAKDATKGTSSKGAKKKQSGSATSSKGDNKNNAGL